MERMFYSQCRLIVIALPVSAWHHPALRDFRQPESNFLVKDNLYNKKDCPKKDSPVY